jgi:uncharacterized paraquat-inducible protein A
MASQRMPRMLERIRRCRHCGIEVDRLPLDYEENPYCASCLGTATERAGQVDLAWQRVGEYAVAMPAARTPR